jgi:hypothetical protein
MSDWDKESIKRLNYSLMNLNDRLGEIRDEFVERNEIAKSTDHTIGIIADMVYEFKEKKERENDSN